jgi:hypothetical protein
MFVGVVGVLLKHLLLIVFCSLLFECCVAKMTWTYCRILYLSFAGRAAKLVTTRPCHRSADPIFVDPAPTLAGHWAKSDHNQIYILVTVYMSNSEKFRGGPFGGIVFYSENLRFVLDTLRVPSRSPTNSSKSDDFPGQSGYFWGGPGQHFPPVLGRFWWVRGVRLALNNTYLFRPYGIPTCI